MKNIADLHALIDSLALGKVKKVKLYKTAGNAMRRVVRQHLKEQKDIDGEKFRARKKQKRYIFTKSGKIKANRKVFINLGRNLNQEASDDGVKIGFSGRNARIAAIHNEGKSVKFERSTGKVINYQMPQRAFLGWSDEMIKEVHQSVIDEYLKLTQQ